MAEEKHMSYWEEKTFEAAKQILAEELNKRDDRTLTFNPFEYSITAAANLVHQFRKKYNLL